mmetsp:Transcript_1592/g.2463  ORF Transcript_1592/g.2463 Transcript_1592/m.2463 type:complete len:234 (-) Transcript_1592:633-1334(-)|eukprot:CAMPEP_0119108052 /NCGR_PEP_ID=MMETSP1180-20130426/13313_1 /TAXON_ID=3052 ORGANISM="Chlamydomonas cf sp, Strain CCMP681" /NCGR_SAMPLE_ID=MMETSP1180 /ASSEMBLY_ACC=CAM_ASM_000741 /LENGTH=233 /DNA_ID=CAMNT_0007093629 /DNA_START=85 /DNA_END=786 /DNA_ORIENTATION=+
MAQPLRLLLQSSGAGSALQQAVRACGQQAVRLTDGSSLQGFHSQEREQEQPVPQLHQGLASSLGFAAHGLGSGVFASSSLLSKQRNPLISSRPSFMAMSTLARRSERPCLGLGVRTSVSTGLPSPTRSFMTEGHVMGTAFMLATDIMFWSGLIGAVVFRRNLIVMLLATEIVMLACNLNFLFAAAYLNDMTGVIMSITITTIAACETAIGLALCVTYFHLRSAVDVEALNMLK